MTFIVICIIVFCLLFFDKPEKTKIESLEEMTEKNKESVEMFNRRNKL
jgi:hypothetical protein